MSPLAPLFSFLMALFGVTIVAASALTAAQTTSTVRIADAPPVPTNVTATAGEQYSQKINLSWTASAGNVYGYKIYRSSGGCNGFSLWYSVYNGVTTFLDTGVTPNYPYCYRVTAMDSSMVESDYSSNASVTSPSGSGTCSSLELVFTNNKTTYTAGEMVNYTYTCSPGGTGSYAEVQLVKPDGSIITYNTLSGSFSTQSMGFGTDNLTSGVYTLRVCFTTACTGAGLGGSAAFTVIGDSTAPSAPLGLSATAYSSSQINLSWTASSVSDGVTEYKIYRGGNLVSYSNTTTYSDAGLSAGTSYTYTVAAQDAAGNLSPQSASVSATTLSSSTPTTSTSPLTPTTSVPGAGAPEPSNNDVGVWAAVDIATGQIENAAVCTRSVCGLNGEWHGYVPPPTFATGSVWWPTSKRYIWQLPGQAGHSSGTFNFNTYVFTVSGGTIYNGQFTATAVTPTPVSTYSTTTPTYVPTATSTQTWNYIAPIPVQTQVPVYTPTSTVYIPAPSIAPITALPFSPTSTSTQFSQTPVLTQAPIAAEERRIELESQERFFAERRAILQDLRAMERLVKQDIVDVDAKLLKAYKEKLLALKPGEEKDVSALQNYREKITELRSDEEPSVATPSFADPRAEAKALKQMKQGLRQFERYIVTIEVKVTRIEKDGITVDAPIKEALATAKAMAKMVKSAKTYDDIRDIVDSLPDIGQALNDSIPRLVELLRLPRIFGALDKNIAEAERAITQTRAVAKKLKLDVADYIAEMQALFVEAKGVIAATKADPAAIDDLSSTLEETVLSNVDGILDLAAHIKTVGSIRQAVNRAAADAKRYESRIRRLEKAKEDMQTAVALLEQFNEYTDDLKNLAKQKLTPEVGDQIIANVRAMGDMRDELEDILRLSKPDPLETEIKKLFSASGEKLKPFDVEKLEQ